LQIIFYFLIDRAVIHKFRDIFKNIQNSASQKINLTLENLSIKTQKTPFF